MHQLLIFFNLFIVQFFRQRDCKKKFLPATGSWLFFISPSQWIGNFLRLAYVNISVVRALNSSSHNVTVQIEPVENYLNIHLQQTKLLIKLEQGWFELLVSLITLNIKNSKAFINIWKSSFGPCWVLLEEFNMKTLKHDLKKNSNIWVNGNVHYISHFTFLNFKFTLSWKALCLVEMVNTKQNWKVTWNFKGLVWFV